MFVSRETALSYALLMAVFISLLFVVGSHYVGDVYRYAGDVLTYSSSHYPAGQNPLWEFGHLLWRPSGWIVWKVSAPLLRAQFPNNPLLQVMAAMGVIDIVAAAIGILVIYSLMRRVCRHWWQAVLVTLAFMCTNPFLSYMWSGTAYLPGLVIQLLGLLVLLQAVATPAGSYHRAMLGGVLLALSALMWLMYLMAIPGVLFTVFAFQHKTLSWRNAESMQRLRLLGRTVLAGAITGVLIYGIGAAGRGASSFGDVRAWIADAGHGISQDRTLARMVTGVPRAFFDLGNDGLILKRFAFKDPYAPVSFLDLLRLSLWKLFLVYGALLALVVQLWSSREKGWLISLTVTAIPVLFFSLVLFEPSVSERYLGVFAVLFLALASVIGGSVPKGKPVILAVLVVFLVVLPLANAKSHIESRRSAEMTAAVQRIVALRQVLTPNSLVVLLSIRDGFSQFLERSPFHPAVYEYPPVHGVIEAGTVRTLHWRMEFAQRSLASWEQGGEVWISRRLFAARPQPQWNWVEADDRRVKWADLPEFFGRFETESAVAGDDGFVRLAHSESNRQWLLMAAR